MELLLPAKNKEEQRTQKQRKMSEQSKLTGVKICARARVRYLRVYGAPDH